MATITASLFSALDGVVDPTIGDWHFPYFNEEMGEAVGGTHDADVMLFGRVTYDSFAGAWPDRETAGEVDAPFAKRLGEMRKVVATRGDQGLGWRNVERTDDVVATVKELRDEPGVERVLVAGSLSVVRQLLAAGQLDELRLLVHPVAARHGERLFDDADAPQPMTLLRSAIFPTGVVRLIYAPSDFPNGATYDDVKGKTPDA
jgi:dihydrofolate reductase